MKLHLYIVVENGSISVGLANSQFPKHGRCVGGDVNSFGYMSKDGCLYHGDDTVGIHFGPTFTAGDVIGCGLVYPPLAADQGEILFTRNGEIIGVVELLDVGLLDVPWYPIVGLNCEQAIEFNYGSQEFRFPILEFEAEELKNRWGYETTAATSSPDTYCMHVYNQLIAHNGGAQSSSEKRQIPAATEAVSLSNGFPVPVSQPQHSKTKFYGSLSHAKTSWSDTVVHEIPIRKRKFATEDNEENDPVVYQRFKTWTHSESSRGGSWAGSSINDSWEV